MTNMKLVVAALMGVASATKFSTLPTGPMSIKADDECKIPVDATLTITNHYHYHMHMDGKPAFDGDDVSDISGKMIKPGQTIERQIKPRRKEKGTTIVFNLPRTLRTKAILTFTSTGCNRATNGLGPGASPIPIRRRRNDLLLPAVEGSGLAARALPLTMTAPRSFCKTTRTRTNIPLMVGSLEWAAARRASSRIDSLGSRLSSAATISLELSRCRTVTVQRLDIGLLRNNKSRSLGCHRQCSPNDPFDG